MTERIPELEAVPKPREASRLPEPSIGASEGDRSAARETKEPPRQRSWFVRFFFGP
jgi:hypothetical protein